MQTTCLNNYGWDGPTVSYGEGMTHSHLPGLKCQLNKSAHVLLNFQLNIDAMIIMQDKFPTYGL